MPAIAPDKRARLITAAEKLFHRQGLEGSSIADVAAAAKVPTGNVYYYFKTKDELVEAVSLQHNQNVAARLAGFDALKTPLARLNAYLDFYDTVAEDRAAHGCPIGGLCTDANRGHAPLAGQARSTFAMMLGWLESQFKALGAAQAAARQQSQHIIAGVQGSILLAHSFGEPQIIRQEIRRLKETLKGASWN